MDNKSKIYKNNRFQILTQIRGTHLIITFEAFTKAIIIEDVISFLKEALIDAEKTVEIKNSSKISKAYNKFAFGEDLKNLKIQCTVYLPNYDKFKLIGMFCYYIGFILFD